MYMEACMYKKGPMGHLTMYLCNVTADILNNYLDRVMSQIIQSFPATAPTLKVFFKHQCADINGVCSD